jgi:hypothetical protein
MTEQNLGRGMNILVKGWLAGCFGKKGFKKNVWGDGRE